MEDKDGCKIRQIIQNTEENGIKDIELQRAAGFSGNIMTRIRRNEYISLESVEKICKVLKCKVDDIVSFR